MITECYVKQITVFVTIHNGMSALGACHIDIPIIRDTGTEFCLILKLPEFDDFSTVGLCVRF